MAWEDVEFAIWDLWRTFLGGVAIVAIVGIPLAMIYGLVRFIKWAWTN